MNGELVAELVVCFLIGYPVLALTLRVINRIEFGVWT